MDRELTCAARYRLLPASAAAIAVFASLLLAPCRAAAQAADDAAAAAPAEATGPEPATPAWDWRQVLSAPRILNRFTAITVDGENPEHVIVGTEEGTIIRTYDGGRTWEERELTPNVVARRSLALRAPNLEALNRHPVGLGANRLQARSDLGPPASGAAGSSASGSGAAANADNQFGQAPPARINGTAAFLASSVLPRDDAISPVRRIAICPGGRYPLVVATTREVFASIDDGTTFLRLYAAPAGLLAAPNEPAVTGVACSPNNPNDIVVAVSSLLGILRSTDGGVLFLNNVTGAPAGGTNFATFDEAGAHLDRNQAPVLLFAADSALYVGDPDSSDGVTFAYPDYDDPSLGPWESITWITTTTTGQIWIATENGVRFSPDGGGTWRAADRSLFDRKPSVAIAEGVTDSGRSRIAVALQDSIYSTEDGGRSFQPFFLGITRRAVNALAVSNPQPGHPSRWWVAAGGELWASTPENEPRNGSVDAADARWARERIRATPSLAAAIDEAWVTTHLVGENVRARAAAAALIPRLGVLFYSYQPAFLSSAVQTGAFHTLDQRVWSQRDYSIYLYANWNLGNLLATRVSPDAASAIYTIRQDVQFVIEDAWHERLMLLHHIARGELNRLETDVARERIGALEAVLQTWSSRARR